MISSSFCRLLFLIMLMLPTHVPAGEDTLLTQIATQTAQHQVVQASFTQNKQMAALKRPLITEGRLVYSRDHGVLWQIEKPYRITYLLGEEQIIEIAADGSRKQRGVKDIPGLSQVGRIFRAMLGADTSTLQAQFNIQADGNPAEWHIHLQPKQAQVRQFLTALQLTGGQFVQTIQIDEASGDQTLLKFSNTQADISPTPEDLLLLQSLKTR